MPRVKEHCQAKNKATEFESNTEDLETMNMLFKTKTTYLCVFPT